VTPGGRSELPGRDHGLPTIGHGREWSGAPIHRKAQAPGMEQPVRYWDPAISPSGMPVCRGARVPALRGNPLVRALAGKPPVQLAAGR